MLRLGPSISPGLMLGTCGARWFMGASSLGCFASALGLILHGGSRSERLVLQAKDHGCPYVLLAVEPLVERKLGSPKEPQFRKRIDVDARGQREQGATGVFDRARRLAGRSGSVRPGISTVEAEIHGDARVNAVLAVQAPQQGIAEFVRAAVEIGPHRAPAIGKVRKEQSVALFEAIMEAEKGAPCAGAQLRVRVDEDALAAVADGGIRLPRGHHRSRRQGHLLNASAREASGLPKSHSRGELRVAEARQMGIEATAYRAHGLVDERKGRDKRKPIPGSIDKVQPIRPLGELVGVSRLVIAACIDSQVLTVELQA